MAKSATAMKARDLRAPVQGEPASVAACLGLARALLAEGRAAEAFQSADRALGLGADTAEVWEILGGALEALGETAIAVSALERALSLAPDRADLNASIGRLYEALDRPFDAAARYQRALALAPGLIEPHLALSGLFGRAGQFVEARAHAEAALALQPASRGAHQNLATICEHEGFAEKAEAHRERAYRGAALIVTRAAQPRRRVLTLASAARANSPDRYLIPSTRYDRLTWFIAYADEDPDAFDVVFNAIADPDAAALTSDKATAFLARCRKPALNPPEKIARTARDGAASLFAGVDNLVVPAAARVASGEALPERDPDQLWLMRPLGSHGGEQLQKLPWAQIRGGLAEPRYLTAYHDYRSQDGLYRKYRVFFVDRQPFPYHLAIHDDWLVHYQNSGTAADPKRVAEELRFLQDPLGALGAAAWRAIGEVGERLDLDFAGVDFSVIADGRALIFEANATMNAHPEPADSPLAHKNPFVQRIFEAFWKRLESV